MIPTVPILHDAGPLRNDGTQRCLRCGRVISFLATDPFPAGPVTQRGYGYEAGDDRQARECRAGEA